MNVNIVANGTFDEITLSTGIRDIAVNTASYNEYIRTRPEIPEILRVSKERNILNAIFQVDVTRLRNPFFHVEVFVKTITFSSGDAAKYIVIFVSYNVEDEAKRYVTKLMRYINRSGNMNPFSDVDYENVFNYLLKILTHG